MSLAETDQPPIFLSTMPARRRHRRVALAMVAVLIGAFAVSAPFAAVPLTRVEAFIASYESILVINDLITAALLYAQFAILRTRGFLVLASGYLFTALMVVPHMLVFPGVFTPTGLLDAGPSSAAWIYVFWHIGFPVAVLIYVFRADSGNVQGRARVSIALSVAAIVALVVALTWISTAGEPFMPKVMADATQRASSIPYVIGSVWLLTLVTLGVLWWGRPRKSVIDLWLAVVLCAWLCEIMLSVILAPARFSLGFYLGRLYGLIAASVVLLFLLSETIALYAQLVRAIATERRERGRRLSEMEAMLSHLARVGDLGSVVTHLIHEVNQPLTAIGNYLGALQRLAAMGETEKVASTIDKTIGQSERAREIIRRLRDFVAKREIERRPEPLATTVDDAIAVAQAATGRTGVEIEVTLDPRVDDVVIDRLQIEQVLVNLIRNASEAMAASPRRRLVIASRTIDHEKIELSIADSGPASPPSCASNCSNRSTPPRRPAWASACRSAASSSRRMAKGCRSPTILAAARSFASPCRSQAARRHAPRSRPENRLIARPW